MGKFEESGITVMNTSLGPKIIYALDGLSAGMGHSQALSAGATVGVERLWITSLSLQH